MSTLKAVAGRIAVLFALAVLGLAVFAPPAGARPTGDDPGITTRISSQPAVVKPGGKLTYTVKVTNYRDIADTDRVVSTRMMVDQHLDSAIKVSAGKARVSGRNIIWTIDELKPGETVTERYTVLIDEQRATGLDGPAPDRTVLVLVLIGGAVLFGGYRLARTLRR
jgi:hypothetical protein